MIQCSGETVRNLPLRVGNNEGNQMSSSDPVYNIYTVLYTYTTHYIMHTSNIFYIENKILSVNVNGTFSRDSFLINVNLESLRR